MAMDLQTLLQTMINKRASDLHIRAGGPAYIRVDGDLAPISPDPISAAEVEAPVEELRDHVRQAAVAHIDETSWWQGRDKMWLWTAVARLATVFGIAPSRGGNVARKILGTEVKQVV